MKRAGCPWHGARQCRQDCQVSNMADRAVFLDRDHTIIDDPGYIDDPEKVSLLPDAAAAIRTLNQSEYKVVVVTNQSGVARGLVSEDRLSEIHDRLRELLHEQGAEIDAIYYCPFLEGPEATIKKYRRKSPLRKPEPGMLLKAADDLGIDLETSWMVGDSDRDILAGQRAGCRTIWINRLQTDPPNGECQPEFIAGSLADAVATIQLDPPRRPDPPEEVQPEEPMPPDLSDLKSTLAEIRDLLRRQERANRQQDFSIARLVATLAQMLAIVAGIWGLVSVFDDGQQVQTRLMLAVFLQLVALSAFIAGQK